MRDLLEPLLKLAEGKIIKRSRNKYFVVYPSAIAACYAVSMCRACLTKYNQIATHPGEDQTAQREFGKVLVSFGLAVGPVLIVPGSSPDALNGDLYGDPVNVASKIGEDIAQDEDIELSTQAYTEVMEYLASQKVLESGPNLNGPPSTVTADSTEGGDTLAGIGNLKSISCVKRVDTVSSVELEHYSLMEANLIDNARAEAESYGQAQYDKLKAGAVELKDYPFVSQIIEAAHSDESEARLGEQSGLSLTECVTLYEYAGMVDNEWGQRARVGLEAYAKAKFAIERTVLSTDMSGFTRLVKKHGIVHFLRMIIAQRSIINHMIRKPEHRGHVIGYEGDNIFAVFTSPQVAIQASVECFRKLEEHNMDQEEDAKVIVKIGLHHGKFYVYENELYGHDAEMGEWLSESVGERMCIQVSEAVEKLVPHEMVRGGKECVDEFRGKLTRRLSITATTTRQPAPKPSKIKNRCWHFGKK